jgi:hypothetical protein
VIVTLKADLDSNGKLLDAASASAAGFLLDLLQSALSGSDLDTARSELFDTMSQIGLDTILEVLKRFDLPDEGKWVDDEENRKMLEKLIGSLAVIEETIRQLRALAELPPPQTVKSSVEDEAVRRRNRLQLSLS